LVRKLFEAEVPEIGEGVVTIQGISREAGSRSKVTVSSANKKVDPVGACVGLRGSRIQTIVRELHGEKIDVIPFSESVEQLLRSALQPAKISDIELKSEFKEARVIVKDDQLSLAIGKHGQNVRLASKLTGWKIDIVSEAKSQESLRKQLTEALFASAPSLEKLPGITGEMVQKLNAAGIGSVEALMQVNASELAMATGLEVALIQEFIDKTAIYRVEAPAAVKEQTAAELFSKLDEAAGETKTVEKKVLASDLFANLDQAAAQAPMPAEAPAPQQQELISTEEPVKKRKRTSKKAALESEPAVKTDQDENEVSQA
jgi:N utilization substance protein A